MRILVFGRLVSSVNCAKLCGGAEHIVQGFYS